MEGITGLQHIGIQTDRYSETEEFYGKLGFEKTYETEHDGNLVCFMTLGQLILEIYEGNPDGRQLPGAINHFALNVKNAEMAYRDLTDMGISIQDEIHRLPFWDNGVEFFTISGVNGERVEFSQYL